jgi:hypothetical protein
MLLKLLSGFELKNQTATMVALWLMKPRALQVVTNVLEERPASVFRLNVNPLAWLFCCAAFSLAELRVMLLPNEGYYHFTLKMEAIVDNHVVQQTTGPEPEGHNLYLQSVHVTYRIMHVDYFREANVQHRATCRRMH